MSTFSKPNYENITDTEESKAAPNAASPPPPLAKGGKEPPKGKDAKAIEAPAVSTLSIVFSVTNSMCLVQYQL